PATDIARGRTKRNRARRRTVASSRRWRPLLRRMAPAVDSMGASPRANGPRRKLMVTRFLAAVAVVPAIAAGGAAAQDWPTRPVTLVVPYAAGGPVDIVTRIVTPKMSEVLGQQLIVENMPGAGGMTGAVKVARAAPDGYTFLQGPAGVMTQNQ